MYIRAVLSININLLKYISGKCMQFFLTDQLSAMYINQYKCRFFKTNTLSVVNFFRICIPILTTKEYWHYLYTFFNIVHVSKIKVFVCKSWLDFTR